MKVSAIQVLQAANPDDVGVDVKDILKLWDAIENNLINEINTRVELLASDDRALMELQKDMKDASDALSQFLTKTTRWVQILKGIERTLPSGGITQ